MYFRSVSEKDSRLFSRKIFFHKLLWTCGLQFWLPCRKVYEKKSNFFDQRPKVAEILKVIFSLNGSLRHVEYSSDNPFEKILDKNPKMFHSVSEKDWKDEIYSGKSSKVFLWARKTQFWQPSTKFIEEKPKIFAQALKMPEKDFQRKPLLKLFQWTVRMHFLTNMAIFFCQKARFFCLKVRKW